MERLCRDGSRGPVAAERIAGRGGTDVVAAELPCDGRKSARPGAIAELPDGCATQDSEGLMGNTLGSLITGQVMQLLTGTSGVNLYLSALAQENGQPLSPFNIAQVRAQNVAPDIAEKSNTMQYPAVNIYCEKIVNRLTEKFRTFSGNVQTTVELRHSLDRLDGLQDELDNYADAIMQVLNANRGDWGNGMFYCGEYQTAFGPVKHGGKNFLQVAKITFEIGVSRS
jgi:hypothetical protein